MTGDWHLRSTDPATGCVYLANGYLGTTVSPDAGLLSGDAGAWYMRGLYVTGEPYPVDRLAVLPLWSGAQLQSDARIAEYRRTLDLRCALLTTEMVLEEDRGRIHVEQAMFFSRADRHRVVTRTRFRPEFSGTLECRIAVETPPQADVPVETETLSERAVLLRGRSRTYDVEVAESIHVLEERWRCSSDPGDGGVTCLLSTDVEAGDEVTLTQVIAVASGLDGEAPDEIVRTQPGPYDALLEAHTAAWNRLWDTDIEIEGDQHMQQFVRAALASLWSTVWPDDRWSIAPMGLSSNGYNGHIFWDAELWMYPPLLLTHPALARSCVSYREWTAPAARERASGNGMEGTQYPWEAAFTGEEMTPQWADTRDFQLHVTADVALGQWWYYLNTGDQTWLREQGYPVIRACAEYWTSRVEWHADRQRYEISDVVCADEYAAHVNNDAFTNAAVRSALRVATRASEILEIDSPPLWNEIADRIHIPYDAEHRRHLEFDGFDGRLTKQADVELLAFPLEAVTDPGQVARDLDYYASVIDPDGPAMSFSIYAIVSAQLGRPDDALMYLRRSFEPNTRPPFWLFSETPTNDEFHFCTGIGGALQAFLFGFTGIRLREGYVVIDPILPPGWTRLRLTGLFLQGARADLDIEPDGFVLRRHAPRAAIVLDVRRTGGGHLAVSATSAEGVPLHLLLPERDDIPNAGASRAVLSLAYGQEQRVQVATDEKVTVLDICLRGHHPARG